MHNKIYHFNHFNVYSSVALSIFTLSCSHHHLLFFKQIEVLFICNVSGIQQSGSKFYINMHVYVFFFRFFSFAGYYKMLNIVSRAILVVSVVKKRQETQKTWV